MIKVEELSILKNYVDVLADIIPGGIIFLYVEGDTVAWKRASKAFDMDVFAVGRKVSPNGVSRKAVLEKKTFTEKVPRSVYGKRLVTIAIPVADDQGEVIGSFSTVIPKLHPVANAFPNFAPILAEMFHEGGFLYMTDLDKVAYRQSSSKFDMENIRVGYGIKEGDVPYKVIQSQKPVYSEIGKEKYGIPVAVASYPLFDEDNKDELVATFGIVLPKGTAAILRDVSENLQNNIAGIASAIEELAAAASNIHANEQNLNNNIKEITDISEQINKVSVFIKEIADETKMLGLNASIEAARANEAGRGFNVVATQIRKLSDQSKSTVPQIKKLTDNIKEKVDTAMDTSGGNLLASQEQAAATEEITASIEEIRAMTEQLNSIAKTL